jgi:hypothetical protein
MVQSEREEKHHIKILNGLALLLIAKPKSDIAAVTQWRTGSEVKLLWSKNERINDTEELQYIETLLRMVQEGSDGLKILGFVIRRCHAKIHFRITKLAKSFKESMARMSNLWGLDENIPAHRELIDQLLKSNYCRGRTVIGSLDAFTHEVVDIKKSADVDAFLEIIYFCWLLTSEITQIANLKLVLNDLQVRYLKKVGDYWRIVMRFSDLKKKLHGASISVEQVFNQSTLSRITNQ